MIYILENENIKISVNTYGGELNSIFNKNNNTEYLWDGNPEGWKYHAPTLFPIVGKVKDSHYKLNDEIYELPQHGLARISEFQMIEKNSNSIVFELQYSEKTLEVYPFKFKLHCSYTIIDSTVKIQYKVVNIDDKDIYFSIGAHPAFMCPINSNDNIEDYYLEFDKKENASIKLLTKEGYLEKKERLYLEESNIINLRKDTFENDALIFSNLNSKKVALKSYNHNKTVTVDFSQFPYLGIWAPTNGAKFICIEPWYGHADYNDFNGDFSEKEGIITLTKNNEFDCSFTISID